MEQVTPREWKESAVESAFRAAEYYRKADAATDPQERSHFRRLAENCRFGASYCLARAIGDATFGV